MLGSEKVSPVETTGSKIEIYLSERGFCLTRFYSSIIRLRDLNAKLKGDPTSDECCVIKGEDRPCEGLLSEMEKGIGVMHTYLQYLDEEISKLETVI